MKPPKELSAILRKHGYQPGKSGYQTRWRHPSGHEVVTGAVGWTAKGKSGAGHVSDDPESLRSLLQSLHHSSFREDWLDEMAKIGARGRREIARVSRTRAHSKEENEDLSHTRETKVLTSSGHVLHKRDAIFRPHTATARYDKGRYSWGWKLAGRAKPEYRDAEKWLKHHTDRGWTQGDTKLGEGTVHESRENEIHNTLRKFGYRNDDAGGAATIWRHRTTGHRVVVGVVGLPKDQYGWKAKGKSGATHVSDDPGSLRSVLSGLHHKSFREDEGLSESAAILYDYYANDRNSGLGNTVWRPDGETHVEDAGATGLDDLLGRELGSKVRSLYDAVFGK